MEQPQEEKVSLVNINGGAAVEMFDHELEKVMANISDINTGMGARSVTLKVTIKPSDEGRTVVGYAIEAKSTTCGVAPVKGVAHVRLDSRGKSYAQERNPNQPSLPGLGTVKAFRKE